MQQMETYPNFKPIVIVSDAFMATSATAIRAGLEAFGLRTSLFLCGLETHVWDVLAGKLPDCDDIIFDCHGEEGQLLFEVASRDTAGFQPVRIGPAEVRARAQLSHKFVISLACTTGTPALAEAFLAGGCRGFMGPHGCPHVHVGFLFVLQFYRHLLQHIGSGEGNSHLAAREALEAARHFDVDAAMFTIYET
ncbi:MAG: hypothetical protein JO316_16885 [Abitibacteriaceae bacterium]|nr:hypothetical protein [Abditibacteriaceae bacterium]